MGSSFAHTNFFFQIKMSRILIFSTLIYISDVHLYKKDAPKDIELIKVHLWSSASIGCNLPSSDNVKKYSIIKVVTWYKNNSEDPIYR